MSDGKSNCSMTVILWRRFSYWFRLQLCRLFDLAGVPLMVCPVDLVGIGGVPISVKSSATYTIISVNGYDLYFKRLTGRWDGTGSGNPSVISHALWGSDIAESAGIAQGLKDVAEGDIKPFAQIQKEINEESPAPPSPSYKESRDA